MSDAPQNGPPLASAPHFLRRVIDGAFDRASPLEPRRPSRFDPQTIGIVDAVADRGDPLGSEGDPSLRGATADGAQSARPRLPNLDATLRPGRSRRDFEDRGPGARGGRPLETGDRDSEVAADLDERSSPRSSANQAGLPTALPIEIDAGRPRSARPDRLMPPLALDESIARRVVHSRPPTPERADARPEAPPLQAWRERLEPAAEWKPVPGEPARPVRDRNERPVVGPVTGTPPAWHELLQARIAATPAPDPVVNVTIGRIEVRVAPAAQAPTGHRAGGPKPMGLDQYLRQRGGRR